MKKQLPRIKKSFTSNGAYKAVALVVALVIWITTLWGQKDVVLVRNMEIEVLLKPSLTLVGNYQKNVQLKLAGSKGALKRFRQSTNVVTLNLNNVGKGRHQIEISETLMDLPNGVRFLAAEPSKLNLNVREAENE